jgi:hypothetical protein
VRGAGFIIPKVRLMHGRGESFPEECAQRDHICLLDDFGLLRPVAPENHIQRHRSGRVRCEVHILQVKETGKLFEQIGPDRIRWSCAQRSDARRPAHQA